LPIGGFSHQLIDTGTAGRGVAEPATIVACIGANPRSPHEHRLDQVESGITDLLYRDPGEDETERERDFPDAYPRLSPAIGKKAQKSKISFVFIGTAG
jgi:hypothetical protein